MQGWQGGLLLVAGLGCGFVAGWGLASRNGEIRETDAALRAREEAAAAAKARYEADLAALRDARRRPREATGDRPAGEIPGNSRPPFEDKPSAAARSEPTAEERVAAGRAALRTARAELATAMAAHDGEKALALLRQFSAVARDVPEARDDAMKLAIEINKDVQGAGDLRIPMQVFYSGLGDPAIRDLMTWALDNQAASTSDFRVLSAWSLPYVLSGEETIRRFDAAFGKEADVAVQKAMVGSLGSMNSAKNEALLARVLADPARDAGVRAEAAAVLATSADPAVQRAIDAAAQNDADPRVQAAARMSSVVRDPPATGCLVTATTADGAAEAAGIKPGDVIVSYNGRAVPTGDDLRKEIGAAGAAESIPVVLVRDGREHVVQVKPGRLGLPNLHPVTKK